MLDSVNGLDALQHIFDRVHGRVFAGFEREALVSHILKRDNLLLNLLLSELVARNGLVLLMIRAVGAAVDAVVGEIERSEHDDAVAVELLLDLLRHGENAVIFLLQIAFQQDGGFAVRESLAGFRFFKNRVDQRLVVFVLLRISEGFEDLLIVDEFGCFR